jgi:hypothetical protein
MAETIDVPAEIEPKALQVAQGLEELAAWLREHQEFPVAWGSVAGLELLGGSATREEFIRLGDEMGATVRRPYGTLRMEREFAGGVRLHIDAGPSLFADAPVDPPLPEELRRFAPEVVA